MKTCHQPPDLHLSSCRRATIFLVGALECLFFGGVVFGWPHLVYILKTDNVYSNLCNDVNTAEGSGINKFEAVPYGEIFNNSRCMAINASLTFAPGHKVGVESCAPQDEMFVRIYTIGVACYGIPSFLVGYLLHHAGLWATRISAGAMVCLGFIFLGVTTKEQSFWLFPAIILVALGGNQIRMSELQFANMFPTHKATAITLLTSMFTTSASLFLIFKFAERFSVERDIICWCLAGASTFVIWLTFIMPPHHIPCDDEYLDKTDSMEFASLTTEELFSVNRISDEVTMKEVKELSLLKASVSLSSILLQFWLAANLLAVNIYQTTYNYWITVVSCTNNEAETFSVMYSYMNFISAFVAPPFGVLIDCLVRRARRKGQSYRDRRTREIQANIIPLLITTICTFCMYLPLLFFHPIGVYISLVFMALTRPCIVAIATAYLRIRFPVEHFNRMVGLQFTVASLFIMLQLPHFKWSQKMYMPAHATMLVVIALSALNPLHLMVRPLFISTLGSERQATCVHSHDEDKRIINS